MTKAKMAPFSPQWLPMRTSSRVRAVSRNAVLRVFMDSPPLRGGCLYLFTSARRRLAAIEVPSRQKEIGERIVAGSGPDLAHRGIDVTPRCHTFPRLCYGFLDECFRISASTVSSLVTQCLLL